MCEGEGGLVVRGLKGRSPPKKKNSNK